MTRFAKVATVAIVLLGFAASGNAAAQSLGQSISQSLNKETQILQQQADNDRLGAEAERTTAEAEARAMEAGQQMSGAGFPQGSSARYMVAGATNDFAILKVPTYVLPNGVAIQVSGDFSPGEGVTCISLCPTGLAQ
jgi:hypothetical protein